MHRAPVNDRLTGSTGVCIGQPFTQVMLGAPKYARSSRFFCRAASIEGRLLTNAQSIEVCSEQPFTHSCSKLQSMYGAIVYSGMLEAPKFVRSNIFLCYALSIEVCTAADQHVYSVSNARSIEVCSEVCSEQFCRKIAHVANFACYIETDVK